MTRALTFYGSVPQLIVPDNPRALVSEACRYEPSLNATVHDFARHYGVSILPARPYSPRDKASAESAVQVVERWLMARQRHTVLADVHSADAALAAFAALAQRASIPEDRRQPRQSVRDAGCADARCVARAALSPEHDNLRGASYFH